MDTMEERSQGSDAQREPPPTQSRRLMLVVAGGLVVLIGGIVLLLATAPPSPEPDRVIPDEWVTSEESRFFLWGQRLAEVKNPAHDVVFAYFVNHEAPESSARKAEDCARTELARFTRATCYAFGSKDAFSFSGLPAQGGEPDVSCWIAFATATRESGGEVSMDSGDNPQQDASCPD